MEKRRVELEQEWEFRQVAEAQRRTEIEETIRKAIEAERVSAEERRRNEEGVIRPVFECRRCGSRVCCIVPFGDEGSARVERRRVCPRCIFEEVPTPVRW